MEHKQVIVIQKSLNMRKGKMVAQGAHASMGAILNLVRHEEKGLRQFFIPMMLVALGLDALWSHGFITTRQSELDRPFGVLLVLVGVCSLWSSWRRLPALVIPLDARIEPWLMGRFKKICVAVNSERELLDLYERARAANVVCALIQDAGLTEFGGVPTYTAVAIGPDREDVVDRFTKGLPLL